MNKLTLPRPKSDEIDSVYQYSIDAVPDEQIGLRLHAQLEAFANLLRPLDDSAALARYAAGKWSIKEVAGHLIDTERIYAYRLLRISRGDTTPLPGFDENAYVPAGRFDARPLAALQAEFRAVRLSTIALVEGTAPECWSLYGQASGRPFTARALAYIIVGHVAHHLAILQGRYGLSVSSGAGVDGRVS